MNRTLWKVEPRGNAKARQYIEAGEFRIAECIGIDVDANAALIVRAVNSHDALVAACRALLDTINATGGLVVAYKNHIAPAADEEWTDLGAAAVLARDALKSAGAYGAGRAE